LSSLSIVVHAFVNALNWYVSMMFQAHWNDK